MNALLEMNFFLAIIIIFRLKYARKMYHEECKISITQVDTTLKELDGIIFALGNKNWVNRIIVNELNLIKDRLKNLPIINFTIFTGGR